MGCLSVQETLRPDLSLPKAIIIPMTPHSPCSSIASAMDQLSDDQLLRGAKVANLPSSHTLCMYNGHQKEGKVVKRLWWRPENRRVKGDSSLRWPEEWESKSVYIRLENIWILGILPVACLHWQLCLLFWNSAVPLPVLTQHFRHVLKHDSCYSPKAKPLQCSIQLVLCFLI